MSINARKASPVVLALLILVALWHTRHESYENRPWKPLGVGQNGQIAELRTSTDSRRPLAFYPGVAKPPGSNYSRTVVLAKGKDEYIGWLSKELPDHDAKIYEIDKPNAELRVPKNKGHEAMVYLTYLIDHYDSLPDTIIFIHAHRNAWHNNYLLGLDTATTLKRLSDSRIARQGYMNLRCHLDPGCPNWIHMDRAPVDFDETKKPEEKQFSFELFREMFPGHRPPPVLSQPCCAQFAISRDRALDNPKELYEHLRDWLLATPLEDQDSGRVFEYTWQYLFTRNAEYCPAMNSCYCDGYGICFGSAAKLDGWLKKLRRRELADEEHKKATDEGKSQEFLHQMEREINKMNVELQAEKVEAYKRGDDEKQRSIERERLPGRP